MDPDAITISPRRVLCPAHGEHLRAPWPKGFLFVSMTIFTAAIERDPEKEPGTTLLEACGWQPGHDDVSTDRINEITLRRPLCYFVERSVIRKALMGAQIGRLGRCRTCGKRGLGGPYQVNNAGHITQIWLCFECALDAGEKQHRTYPDGGAWGQGWQDEH